MPRSERCLPTRLFIYRNAARPPVRSRGISPVVGVVCLLAVTALLAAVVVAAVPAAPDSAPVVATFDLDVDADGMGELRVTHTGGNEIDPESIGLDVHVADAPLAKPPPVPFFSARGFESAPTGAFNSGRTEPWRAGETASLALAGTNEPAIDPGDTVTVRLYVDGDLLAELETVA